MSEKPVFNRQTGADTADENIRMGKDELDAMVSNLSVGELLGRLEGFSNGDGNYCREMFPWADRFVMGFPLPSWQRPPSWDEEQKVRFIQSIWTGVDLGSYMVNDIYKFMKDKDGKSFYQENSEIVVDGQQRLSAIEEYVTDKFPVADANGVERYWSELPKIERRRFANRQFAKATIKSWDEDLLRKAYDLRSFGGTPHTEEQRATRKKTP